jgi:hypothetical protein
MLSTVASSSSDIVFLVMQGILDFKTLRSVSLACRSLNRVLCGTELGRKKWLEIGKNVTSVGEDGYNVDDIKRCFIGLNERSTFFPMLRQLVCPWTVFPLQCPLKIDVLESDHELVLLEGFDNAFYIVDNTVTEVFHSTPTGTEFHNVLQNPPKTPAMSQKIRDLSSNASLKKIVPDFSHDNGCEYCVFPVHAGVFAVSEVFSRLFDNGPELLDHGIYFFSHFDGRMLRHIKFDGFQKIQFGCMVSRPTELWLLTMDGVDYFGPSCQLRFEVCQHSELMDPALWSIGRGDHAAAISYMQRIGAPLDTKSLISGRTLLHYAAKEGHSDAVRALLVAGFRDVDAVDYFDHTALYMATAELRYEVVEILLKTAGARVDVGEYILSCVGDFVQYRPYARSVSRARDEIDRFVPTIIRLLLEANPLVVIPDDDTICNPSILSCPEAVRMLCASGEKVSMDLVAFSFSEFRTREHALSAIHSLYVLVREFNMDINVQNTRDGFVGEYPLLHLAQYSIAESVIAAVDFLGADPSVIGRNKLTVRGIVEKRLRDSNGGDGDARRIVEFLDSRGL